MSRQKLLFYHNTYVNCRFDLEYVKIGFKYGKILNIEYIQVTYFDKMKSDVKNFHLSPPEHFPARFSPKLNLRLSKVNIESIGIEPPCVPRIIFAIVASKTVSTLSDHKN